MHTALWKRRAVALAAASASALLVWASIVPRAAREVVVYTAQDREFAEPLFQDFTRRTGIVVRAKWDTESTKTVGLANALLAERQRPRADVFWNNEILHTLRLARGGALSPYAPPGSARFPLTWRAEDASWHGFAARARVLLLHSSIADAGDAPQGIADLVLPRWRGQVAIAKPLFGTTATHAACLFAHWGEPRARQFFHELMANQAQVLAGNRHVAQAVASGAALVGLTDTDDAVGELDRGSPVRLVYPDQGPRAMGTLIIPNTLSMVRGAPHPAAARQVIDFLWSAEVEDRLAAGPSAQLPLHPESQVMPRFGPPAGWQTDSQAAFQAAPETTSQASAAPVAAFRVMHVDWAAAARVWDRAAEFLRHEMLAEP